MAAALPGEGHPGVIAGAGGGPAAAAPARRGPEAQGRPQRPARRPQPPGGSGPGGGALGAPPSPPSPHTRPPTPRGRLTWYCAAAGPMGR